MEEDRRSKGGTEKEKEERIQGEKRSGKLRKELNLIIYKSNLNKPIIAKGDVTDTLDQVALSDQYVRW